MIALLVIGFVILAGWQIPDLVQKRWWRELIVFSVLWSMGLILSVMLSLGITLPPITTSINNSITGILGI